MRLMRSVTLLLLSTLMMFVMQASSWAFYYDEGNNGDTEATAYVIDSLEDFIMMRDRVNDGTESEGKYYRLETDLEYNRNAIQGHQEIGWYEHPFKGHFDGNGKTIHIMNEVDDSNSTNMPFMSLLGYIESTGIAIKNLNLTGRVKIHMTKTYPYTGMYPAGLASELYSGIIENCTFTGDVETSSNISSSVITYGSLSAAGLVGAIYENAIIRGCTFSGTVRVHSLAQGQSDKRVLATVGGIAHINSGIIENCKVLPGSIISAKSENYISYAGGITGGFLPLTGSRISGCTSNANIEDADYRGGIIGALGNSDGLISPDVPSDIPDNLNVFDNTFTGAEYAIGWPQANIPTHEFNGHTYRVFKESLTWQEAKEKCEAMGGYLATITSKAESDFILSFANEERSYWIGGTDEGSEGVWRWVTGEPFTFTNWNAGEPNNFDGNEHFLEFNGGEGNGRWNDTTNAPLDSEGGRYYICEWGDYTPDLNNDIALSVDVLESGTSRGISNIIQYIAEPPHGGYLNSEGKTLDEAYLFNISAENFSKEGFTADGNTRLILRAQSTKPGLIRFSVPASLDAKLENLSRDHWGKPSIVIATTPVSDKVHQASAVLTAPEAYPLSMGLPSATFRLRTFFTADDGSTESNDLSLTVELTPVILIHGLESNSVHAFRIGGSQGVHHRLTQDGFYTDYWDYDGTKGPEDIFKDGGSSLYSKIVDVFDVYKARNIACTKVDIVAHSMGGLMARRFLETDECYSPRSYRHGLIRRIVTIATPHEGSPIASYFMKEYEALHHSNAKELYVFTLMKRLRKIIKTSYESSQSFGKSADSAFRDLAINSSLTSRLKRSGVSVPVYVIYGKCKTQFNELIEIIQQYKDAYDYAEAAVKVATLQDLPAVAKYLIEIFITDKVKASVNPFADPADKVKTVFRVLYGDDDYDLMVGASSALSIFDGSAMPLSGLEYNHVSLCGQEDTGAHVSNLLRGELSRFKVPSVNSSLAVHAAADSVDSEDVEELDNIDDFFVQHYELEASASSITVPGKLTLTVKSPEALSEPVYMSLEGETGCKFLQIDEAGKTSAQVTLSFTSGDTGIMKISCFSGSSEDRVYISNTVQIAVMPELNNIAGLRFLHDNSTIYTNAGSEIALNVFAVKPDGSMFDVASPAFRTKWSAEDSSIARVTDDGRVLGLKEGATILTATNGGFSASVNVLVGPALVESSTESAAAPSITTTSLLSGRVGESYTAQLEASGTSPITWRLDSGRIPGLTLNASGLLSGTPTRAGSFTLNITASNDAGRDSTTLTLTIAPSQDEPVSPDPEPSPSITAPSIATSTIPEGAAGRYYSASLSAYGTRPITFALVGGALPEGLSFNNGTISGTPESSGSFSFVIRVTNSAGRAQRRFTLIINASQEEQQDEPDSPVPPSITTSRLPNGTTGIHYSAYVLASGTRPITLRLTDGRLPEGLSFTDGSITGTPTKTGTFTFTIAASNSVGRVESDFTITINEASPDEHTDPGQDPEPANAPDPEPEPVPDIVIGRARSISSLSTYDIDALSNDTSMIAAILPELSVNTSGNYNFRNTAIYSNVPAGLPLVWNGFASGWDDSSANFFNVNGANVSTVPQEHMINITAYLEAGNIYAPVITATLTKDDGTDSRSEGSGSGGGGGCDSGLVGIMLAVLCAMALRKR